MSETDTAADEPQMTVNGITEAQYAMWLHNDPVAQMLMQYLRDFRQDILTGVQTSWINGGLDLANEHDMRGYQRALGEITELRLPTIATFYAQIEALKKAEEELEREMLK